MNIFRFIILSSFILALAACESKSGKTNSRDQHSSSNTKITTNKGHENTDENAHWSYDGDDGPEKWETLCPAYATCNGERQSPINLSSALSTEANVTLQRTYHCVSDIEVVNNGHSIQVNFKGKVVNEITVNGKKFTLKQFHFHCPSEHTLDGKHFEGEAHFVNVAEDGDITVIGLFIKEGTENVLLDKIIRNLPVKAGEKHVITEEICPGKVFASTDKYYVYEGSLTTPPCTEGVNWFVRKESIEASKEQIEAIKKVMPTHNARPVQSLNNRKFGELDE